MKTMGLDQRRVLVSLALLLVGFAAVLFAFRELDGAALFERLMALGPLALLALAPQGVSMVVEAWGWGLAMKEAGHPAPYAEVLAIRMGTESVYQLLPGGPVLSDSLKPVLLARRAGLSIPEGIGAAVYRKYLRLVGQGPYVLACAFFGGASLSLVSEHWLGSDVLVSVVVALGFGLVVLSLLMGLGLRRAAFATQLFGLLERLRFQPHLLAAARRRFEECDRVARAYFSLPPTKVALPVLLSGACWVLEAVETWLCLELVGAHVPFALVLGLDVALSLGRQALVFLPGGVGLQEAGYLAGLTALGVPSPLETSALLSVLKRAKEAAWGVVGFSLLGSFRTPFSTRAPRPAPAS